MDAMGLLRGDHHFDRSADGAQHLAVHLLQSERRLRCFRELYVRDTWGANGNGIRRWHWTGRDGKRRRIYFPDGNQRSRAFKRERSNATSSRFARGQRGITFILARVTILNHPDVLDLAELLERLPQVVLLEALVADDEEPRVRRIVVLRTQIRLRIIRVPFPVVGHFPNTMNASATPLPPRTIYRRPTSVYGSRPADARQPPRRRGVPPSVLRRQAARATQQKNRYMPFRSLISTSTSFLPRNYPI